MTDLERTIRSIVRDELARARPANDAPRLVTIAAYAAARSISESTVRAAIRDGRLDGLRIGRAVRVRADQEIAIRARAGTADPVASAERSLGLRVVK